MATACSDQCLRDVFESKRPFPCTFSCNTQGAGRQHDHIQRQHYLPIHKGSLIRHDQEYWYCSTIARECSDQLSKVVLQSKQPFSRKLSATRQYLAAKLSNIKQGLIRHAQDLNWQLGACRYGLHTTLRDHVVHGWQCLPFWRIQFRSGCNKCLHLYVVSADNNYTIGMIEKETFIPRVVWSRVIAINNSMTNCPMECTPYNWRSWRHCSGIYHKNYGVEIIGSLGGDNGVANSEAHTCWE
jgi:hypothetical protein